MVAVANEDSLLTSILKWIPVEVITVYKFIVGLIPSNHEAFSLWSTVTAIPITALWIAFATRSEGQNVAWRQVILAPIAFTCWAVAMQGDIIRGVFSGWEPWMGSVVLGAGTISLPIFEGILRSLGIPQNY
jgi:hypothetical protein